MDSALFAIIDGFTEALDGSATTEQLQAVRGQVDSWVFSENVRAALHGINDPNEVARLRDALRKLQREAEALASRRQDTRELIRIGGFGGGIALFGAALVTAVTFATPAVLVIPLFGSAGIVWQSGVHSSKASQEITVLTQIAEAAKELANWKDY